MNYLDIDSHWILQKLAEHKIEKKDFAKTIHYSLEALHRILYGDEKMLPNGKNYKADLTPKLKLVIWLWFYWYEKEKAAESIGQ